MKATKSPLAQGRKVRHSSTKHPPNRRGRPSPERSNQITASILQVANRMFFAEGYEGTSMEAVSREVGVPKTTLYKRFPDKNELLRAVIDDEMSAWAARSRGQYPLASQELRDCLIHHVETMLIWSTKPEVRAIHRLVSNLPDTHDSGFIGRSYWGYQNMMARLVGTITSLGPAQGIKTDDPEGVADLLMAMVGGWVVNRNSPEPVEPAEARQLAIRFVDVMLRGKDAW